MVQYRSEYERQFCRCYNDVPRRRPRHRANFHRQHRRHCTHHRLHRHHPRLHHVRRCFARMDPRIPRGHLLVHFDRLIGRFCHPYGTCILCCRRTRRTYPSRAHERSLCPHGLPHSLRRIYHLRLRQRPLLLHHHFFPKVWHNRHDIHDLRFVRVFGVLRRFVVDGRTGRELWGYPKF